MRNALQLQPLKQRFAKFHRDERGDAIQNVMILGLAAIIILGLIFFGRTALKAVRDWWENDIAPEKDKMKQGQ